MRGIQRARPRDPADDRRIARRLRDSARHARNPRTLIHARAIRRTAARRQQLAAVRDFSEECRCSARSRYAGMARRKSSREHFIGFGAALIKTRFQGCNRLDISAVSVRYRARWRRFVRWTGGSCQSKTNQEFLVESPVPVSERSTVGQEDCAGLAGLAMNRFEASGNLAIALQLCYRHTGVMALLKDE